MKFPTMIKKVILRILCKNHNFWTTSSYEKPSVLFYPVFHFAPVSPIFVVDACSSASYDRIIYIIQAPFDLSKTQSASL